MTVRVPPAPLQSVLVSRRVELACRIVLNKSSCPPRHSGRCLSVRAGQERAAEVTGVGANIGAEKLKQQTLEPLRCAWEGCAKALDKKGSLFYNISGTTNAGDRDWSSLHGSTLCRACYVRFSRSGTLQQYTRPSPQIHLKRHLASASSSSTQNAGVRQKEVGFVHWVLCPASMLCPVLCAVLCPVLCASMCYVPHL